MNIRTFFLICCLISATLFVSFIVQAHEGEKEISLPRPGILPGNPLFFLDRWMEKVQLSFANPLRKVELMFDIATERISELKKLADRGVASPSLDRAGQLWQEAFEEGRNQLPVLEERGVEVKDFEVKFLTLAELHQEVLEKVLEQVPDAAKEGIEKAMGVSSRGLERALESVQKRFPQKDVPVEVETLIQEGQEILRQRNLMRLEQELAEKEERPSTPSGAPPTTPKAPPKPPPKSESPSQVPAPSLTPSPAPSRRVQTFHLIAKQWSFEPSILRARKGDHVILKIKSIDVTHGFEFSGSLSGVGGVLRPNQEVTIEFDALESGEFTFRCNVFCGSGHPTMTGKLIVEE